MSENFVTLDFYIREQAPKGNDDGYRWSSLRLPASIFPNRIFLEAPADGTVFTDERGHQAGNLVVPTRLPIKERPVVVRHDVTLIYENLLPHHQPAPNPDGVAGRVHRPTEGPSPRPV